MSSLAIPLSLVLLPSLVSGAAGSTLTVRRPVETRSRRPGPLPSFRSLAASKNTHTRLSSVAAQRLSAETGSQRRQLALKSEASPVSQRTDVTLGMDATQIARVLCTVGLLGALLHDGFFPSMAKADVAGLTKCSQSQAFKKRESKELKSLEKTLSKYNQGTPQYEEISNRIKRTKGRFAKYGESSLLCGPDGLPHLIVAPEFSGHLGEFVIPAIAFLYINGWIGWAGRSYLIWNKANSAKPQDGEILLDVDKMSQFMIEGATWPRQLFRELLTGKLVAREEDITRSAR